MSSESNRPRSAAADARSAIQLQISSLERSRDAIDDAFDRAVDLLANAPKTVTSGLGKSSFIARKMAATMASVRMPALFLHPVDALHGDSGILEPNDVLVVFSKSGETAEVLRLVSLAREIGLSVIAVTARSGSTLDEQADATVGALIERELDNDDVLPTASTTSALVMADLLALGALYANGGSSERLRASHPGGAIGAALKRSVREVMHDGDAMPQVGHEATMADALVELSGKTLGIVCITDEEKHLLGIITDGDVRRLAAERPEISTARASDVMTKEPTAISPDATLHEALTLMERGDRQIAVLPVVDKGLCVGVIRLHDIVRLNFG